MNQSAKLRPGDQAPMFSLPTTSGQPVSLAVEIARHAATVVLFICNHCPYVQAYIPRLIDLQRRFAGKARFIAINSNDPETYTEDSFEKMKEYATRWGLNFPYAHDGTQEVAHAYGAERTPEIFVIDGQGVVRYEGGIDDNYKDATRVTARPLEEAIAAIVAGREVAEPRSHAIGCTIKWKKG